MHIDSQIISYYSKDIFPCHLILTRSDKFIRLCLISTFCCFVVPVLVLLFVALCFFSTRRFVLCLILCLSDLVFFSPFSICNYLACGRELILVFFVRLFDLCLFGFVGFLFLLVSGKGCGL